MTVMVPTMIGLLTMHPDFRPERLASLDTLTYGASPDAPGTAGPKSRPTCPRLDLYQGYGMTEASAILTVLGTRRAPVRRRPAALRGPTCSRGDAAASRTRRAGRYPRGERRGVRPRRQLHDASTGTSPRPPRRCSVAAGTTPVTPATSTNDGYLFLVDRVKDMIVTGGENVYSVEVENAIASHPAVAQVAVIGIPHERLGRGGARRGRAQAGAEATEDEIIEHARASIAGYKVPEVGRDPHRAAAAVGRHEGAQARAACPLLGGPRPGRALRGTGATSWLSRRASTSRCPTAQWYICGPSSPATRPLSRTGCPACRPARATSASSRPSTS